MYGMTLDPTNKGAYSAGPTPDIQDLIGERPTPDANAEIHLLNPHGDSMVVYVWDKNAWRKVETRQLNEISEPLPWEDDPFEKGEGANLVLGEMGLSGKENEVLMVTLDVETLTFESKVKPQDYEQARGYQEIKPTGLKVHIPVYNPAQFVDDATGNVRLLTYIHKMLARELDGLTFAIASERVDRAIVQKEQERAVKESRFDVGKARKEVAKTAESTVL